MMMNLLVKSAVLFGLFALAVSVEFAWQDCGGSIVHFNKLEIGPLPMVLSETSKLFITSNVTLSDDLPVNSEFELVINKTLVIADKKFPLTLPCVDGMGSCRMKVCDLFHLWYNDIVCPFFKSTQHSCACPVRKGAYLDNKVEVDVPFSKFQGIAAQLADGDYSIQFTITDPGRTHTFACLNIQAHLTVHH